MSRRRWYAGLGTAGGALAALALLFAASPGGSDAAATAAVDASALELVAAVAPAVEAPAVPAAPVPVAPAPAPRGPQEGVQVHGSWTLEVRNPDGSLVERREFENALIAAGGATLSKVLGRDNTTGLWLISLAAAAGSTHPCANIAGSAGPCGVREPADTYSSPDTFRNLSVTAPTSGANADKLVLSGSATAANASDIGSVRTDVQRCASSLSPDAAGTTYCGVGYTIFTTTALATPVHVEPGQQVLVTVVISFS